MNESLSGEIIKSPKKLIYFSSDFINKNKKIAKTVNFVRKLKEYKTEEREKIKKLLNDYKEQEKSNYFLLKKNISHGKIKTSTSKKFYDKNNNLIPYSFVGPASLFQNTNSRRHSIRCFGKKGNLEKTQITFSKSEKIFKDKDREVEKEEIKEEKKSNFISSPSSSSSNSSSSSSFSIYEAIEILLSPNPIIEPTLSLFLALFTVFFVAKLLNGLYVVF